MKIESLWFDMNNPTVFTSYRCPPEEFRENEDDEQCFDCSNFKDRHLFYFGFHMNLPYNPEETKHEYRARISERLEKQLNKRVTSYEPPNTKNRDVCVIEKLKK